MYKKLIKDAYLKIDTLLLFFPLADPSAYARLKDAPVPAPATGEYLLWALTFLEIPAGSQIPFCTAMQPACNGTLEHFLKSARTLKRTMAQLTREIAHAIPELRGQLENMVEFCATYAEQAQLTAERGEITLADFRRIFKSYLSVTIQSCCTMLFDQATAPAGAALMETIRIHLEQIGITTPPHNGLQFDYNNYEPYFTRQTPDQNLDDHFESIRQPAYMLGRSRVNQGLASCYSYSPKEENSDAVRTFPE